MSQQTIDRKSFTLEHKQRLADYHRNREPEHQSKLIAAASRAKSEAHRKAISDARKTRKHYCWTHAETGETYHGIPYDFRNKYGLTPTQVSRLVREANTGRVISKWSCDGPITESEQISE